MSLPTDEHRHQPTGGTNGDLPGFYVGLCRPDWHWLASPDHHTGWEAAIDALRRLPGQPGALAAISEDVPARTRGWAGARRLRDWQYERGPDGWLLVGVLGPVLLRPVAATKG